jgi:hypothetical protein
MNSLLDYNEPLASDDELEEEHLDEENLYESESKSSQTLLFSSK